MSIELPPPPPPIDFNASSDLPASPELPPPPRAAPPSDLPMELGAPSRDAPPADLPMYAPGPDGTPPPPSELPPPLEDAEAKKIHMRKRIAQELKETEKTYVESLISVQEVRQSAPINIITGSC